ncbi:MAG TPA: universal stress protein [Acetobacteraceae bacterium]|nr:universal stress protein [Acetobacteraceae bacterium]
MYAEIVLVLEGYATPEPRLRFACRFAADLSARLVVLYVHELVLPPLGLLPLRYPALLAAREARQEEAMEAAEIRSLFDTLSAAAAIEAEWREISDVTSRHIALHARYGDLLLIGARTGAESAPEAALSIAGVIVESGRPALVLPAVPGAEVSFRRILVGWNASREASRAVHDALPFLRRAERVVVCNAPPAQSVFAEAPDPGLDIVAHLARHGVHAVAEQLPAGEDAGAALLARAAALGADLIVAGCYGHARLTEFLLGGVSRTLLRDPHVPLLLSH